jgi:RNA recognition motif-containing protein
MGQKLYVGGIPYSSTEDDLKNYFAEAGEVTSATIITDRYTGRSRGFGFVEMANEDGAKKAIELFDGKEYEGRKLTVNIARPREERGNGDSRE